MIILFILLSLNLYGQINNDIYIQYFKENNIKYYFQDEGYIIFNDKFAIVDNKFLNDIDKRSNRLENKNIFQLIIMLEVEDRINQNRFMSIIKTVGYINTQIVMAKVYVVPGNNGNVRIVLTSEVILNEPEDFRIHINNMCNALDLAKILLDEMLKKI
jgi:hypothetical protein